MRFPISRHILMILSQVGYFRRSRRRSISSTEARQTRRVWFRNAQRFALPVFDELYGLSSIDKTATMVCKSTGKVASIYNPYRDSL